MVSFEDSFWNRGTISLGLNGQPVFAVVGSFVSYPMNAIDAGGPHYTKEIGKQIGRFYS